MRKRKLGIGILVLVVSLFVISVPCVLAQSFNFCNGNFDNDQDVDGTDAATFKSDFGRSVFEEPCPPDGWAPVPITGQKTIHYNEDDGYYQMGMNVEKYY